MTDLRDLTYTYYRRRLHKWSPPQDWKHSSILELGAGITPLAANATDVFFLAVDIAHPHKSMPFPYLQADARTIPLKDSSIDYFISISMLEHVADPAKIALELYRVCRNGGIISVPVSSEFSFIYDPVNWIRTALGLPLANYGIGGFGHLCVLEKQQWKKLFENAGFKVTEALPAQKMDLFETLEFCLVSILFSHLEYNEAVKSGKSSVLARIMPRLSPLLNRIFAALNRLDIPSPGNVSVNFTLEKT